MKIDLTDGYLIEEKSAVNYILKQRYQGMRKGVEVECERLISHHNSFEDALQRFSSLLRTHNRLDAVISIDDYLKCLKSENTRLSQVIKERYMERFYIYTPTAEEVTHDNSIADLIPVGRDNAIKRKDLVQKCVEAGLVEPNTTKQAQDRRMRELIAKARLDYTILNLSNGNGYYRVSREDLQDLQRYIKQEESRAKATFRNLSNAKKLYEDYKAGRL